MDLLRGERKFQVRGFRLGKAGKVDIVGRLQCCEGGHRVLSCIQIRIIEGERLCDGSRCALWSASRVLDLGNNSVGSGVGDQIVEELSVFISLSVDTGH